MKRISNVGIDFIDAYGVRVFCYQFCVVGDGNCVAIAVVNDRGHERQVSLTKDMQPHEAAIRRLANIWKKRSVPRVFRRHLERA